MKNNNLLVTNSAVSGTKNVDILEVQSTPIGGTSEYRNRVINMFSEFTPESINAIMEKLLKWEEEDAEILYKHSQQLRQLQDPTQLLKPIIININSPGGYVDELLALVDMLESMPGPVITRVYGKAYSCAFVLFCMGDERYVGNNANLMYHEIAYGMWGKDSEIEHYHKYSKKLQKRLDKLIASKTGLKIKTLNEWKQDGKDKWLDSKEAVDLGIATDYLY